MKAQGKLKECILRDIENMRFLVDMDLMPIDEIIYRTENQIEALEEIVKRERGL